MNFGGQMIRKLWMFSALFPALAWAGEGAPQDMVWRMGQGILDTVVFGLLGIGLLIFGYKAFAWSVKWNLDKELEHDHNTSVAIVVGAMFIGVSIIIAAVISS